MGYGKVGGIEHEEWARPHVLSTAGEGDEDTNLYQRSVESVGDAKKYLGERVVNRFWWKQRNREVQEVQMVTSGLFDRRDPPSESISNEKRKGLWGMFTSWLRRRRQAHLEAKLGRVVDKALSALDEAVISDDKFKELNVLVLIADETKGELGQLVYEELDNAGRAIALVNANRISEDSSLNEELESLKKKSEEISRVKSRLDRLSFWSFIERPKARAKLIELQSDYCLKHIELKRRLEDEEQVDKADESSTEPSPATTDQGQLQAEKESPPSQPEVGRKPKIEPASEQDGAVARERSASIGGGVQPESGEQRRARSLSEADAGVERKSMPPLPSEEKEQQKKEVVSRDTTEESDRRLGELDRESLVQTVTSEPESLFFQGPDEELPAAEVKLNEEVEEETRLPDAEKIEPAHGLTNEQLVKLQQADKADESGVEPRALFESALGLLQKISSLSKDEVSLKGDQLVLLEEQASQLESKSNEVGRMLGELKQVSVSDGEYPLAEFGEDIPDGGSSVPDRKENKAAGPEYWLVDRFQTITRDVKKWIALQREESRRSDRGRLKEIDNLTTRLLRLQPRVVIQYFGLLVSEGGQEPLKEYAEKDLRKAKEQLGRAMDFLAKEKKRSKSLLVVHQRRSRKPKQEQQKLEARLKLVSEAQEAAKLILEVIDAKIEGREIPGLQNTRKAIAGKLSTASPTEKTGPKPREGWRRLFG